MKKVAIIGAGPAGIEAATTLADLGIAVTLYEGNANPLHNVADKAYLFPNFAAADDMVEHYTTALKNRNITLCCNSNVTDLQRRDEGWQLTIGQHTADADAILVATGYTPFDAHRKEELGYGIYKGVHTSLEMEQMIKEERIANDRGETPRRVVFLQCVGSRDEKTGNHYCSKVCCVTAVKQAIEVKRQLPDTEVYIFYMDLRMWGQHFEELYRQSQQEYGIRYVRGRISEAGNTFDGRVQIKAEDTLMGLPLKMQTDLLVLMVGMEAAEGTRCLAKATGLCGDYGFFQSLDPHLYDCHTALPGLFVAGSCKRPMSLNDVICDGRTAALAIHRSLQAPNAIDPEKENWQKVLQAHSSPVITPNEHERRREERLKNRQLRQDFREERRAERERDNEA